MINHTIEILKMLNNNQTVNNETAISLESFVDMILSHDWLYQHSDDSKKFRKGESSEEALKINSNTSNNHKAFYDFLCIAENRNEVMKQLRAAKDIEQQEMQNSISPENYVGQSNLAYEVTKAVFGLTKVNDVQVKNKALAKAPASISEIRAQQRKEMKETKFKSLDEKGVQDLFGLEKPLNLGFPFALRAVPHALAPQVKYHYFDPDLLRRIILSRFDMGPVMALGEKGVGKSAGFEQFFARIGSPLLSINGGPGVDEDYLFGRASYDGEKVVDQDGLLSYAIRHGLAVCVDEISAIPSKTVLAMNDVLGSAETIVLKHHGINPHMKPEEMLSSGGNMLVRHPWFKFFCTDNTGGKLERSSLYNGTNVLNAATRSRFMTLYFGYMPIEAERKVLLNTVKTHWKMGQLDGSSASNLQSQADKIINGILDFSRLVRDGYANEGSVSNTICLREMNLWLTKFLTYSGIAPFTALCNAFEDAVYTACEESDRPFITEAFLECFGKPLELTLNPNY